MANKSFVSLSSRPWKSSDRESGVWFRRPDVLCVESEFGTGAEAMAKKKAVASNKEKAAIMPEPVADISVFRRLLRAMAIGEKPSVPPVPPVHSEV